MLVAAWKDYEMDRTEVIDTRSLVLYYTMITKIEVREVKSSQSAQGVCLVVVEAWHNWTQRMSWGVNLPPE